MKTNISDKSEIAQLRKELYALSYVIKKVPGCVFWKDRNSVLLGCNDAFAYQSGLSKPEDVVGKTDYDLPWSPAQTKKFLEDDERVMTTMQPRLEFIEEQRQVDGSTAYLLTSKVPMHDSDGNVSGILGTYIDITEKVKVEIALLKAKEEAEVASRAKTEFLANMSHDVKTPLTGIVGMADLIMHDVNAGELERKRAEAIHSCGMQVVFLLNSCLELSKLEMQEWSSKEETFSLKSLFQEILVLFIPSAETKNLTLTIDYDESLPSSVYAHRASLYRVILNLVGNALKFTQEGGVVIRIFLAKPSDKQSVDIGIEVKDTGIGIPEDKQQVIFEKLHRLTPAYEGKIEGSGIGLYIVDQYLKRMGGTISVNSSLGKGSTFTVFLPMTIAEKASLITISTAQEIDSQSSLLVGADSQSILLVEDNPIAQHVTQTLLKSLGFKVDIASTGAEAIEKFSPEKYSLIYMDIGLPDQDGYAVTLAIREKEIMATEAKTPIIALTGHGTMDVQAFCGQAGMQGVLSKPLSREQAVGVWQRYGEQLSVSVAGLTVITN